MNRRDFLRASLYALASYGIPKIAGANEALSFYSVDNPDGTVPDLPRTGLLSLADMELIHGKFKRAGYVPANYRGLGLLPYTGEPQ